MIELGAFLGDFKLLAVQVSRGKICYSDDDGKTFKVCSTLEAIMLLNILHDEQVIRIYTGQTNKG